MKCLFPSRKLFEEDCSVRHLSCVNKAAALVIFWRVKFVWCCRSNEPSHRVTRDTPYPLPHQANWRCDVSFKRPLIALRLVALWWKKSLKSRASLSVFVKTETPEARSIGGKEKLSDDPLTAIFASLDHFYGILWSFELGRSVWDLTAFPYSLLKLQLEI